MDFLNKSFLTGLLLWTATAVSPLFGQLSPGELHRTHAKLEGLENCTQCHVTRGKLSAQKCLDCHHLLADRIKEGKGLHATDEYKKCETCHVEHHGREYKLIYWPNGRDKFDHRKTGFELSGRHADLKCRECHTAHYLSDSLAFKEQGKDLNRTFLGLNSGCLSCHSDEHRGQFNAPCLSCHTMQGWKPAQNFDHQKAGFQLTGKHENVPCEKCHPVVKTNAETSFTKFNGLHFAQCTDCHTDIHSGRLGNNCRNCHTTAGWNQVKSEKFNHDLTRYPLKGRHRTVPCRSCHKQSASKNGLSFQHCLDCHQDFHQGAFLGREQKGACEECHSVQGFSPAKFTVKQHAMTKYPLTGAHLAVPCLACHQKSAPEKGYHFKFSSMKCEACHQDYHRGQLKKYMERASEQTGDTGCAYCHQTESWQIIRFDHNQTDFALTGSHAKIACSRCHQKSKGEGHQFQNVPVHCQSCHEDIHFGQFRRAPGAKTVDCARCHGTDEWRRLKFDHDKDTNFKLTGAHEKVPCEQCHKTVRENGKQFTRYAGIELSCASCHGKTKVKQKTRDRSTIEENL